MGVPDTLVIPRPDDWHAHLRDGELLRAVLPFHAGYARVLAMPNLAPPVARSAEAEAYRGRIAAVRPADAVVEVLAACYLTDNTDPDDVTAGFAARTWVAAKWYPAGATTNAAHGVRSVDRLLPVLERMAAIGMPLCVHAEATDPAVDVFDRERVFLDRVLGPVLDRLPGLRCVLEHATTRDAVSFVRSFPQVVATVTPHHLWWSRNALFDGGLRPHVYCLPIPKRERDRQALVAAVTSGDPRFFAGTDSAPHPIDRKETDCGCAGVFNAPTALAVYATVFEREGALEHLAAFVARNGARFYGREARTEPVVLVREPWTPPVQVPAGDGRAIRVFLGGETLPWRVEWNLGNRAALGA